MSQLRIFSWLAYTQFTFIKASLIAGFTTRIGITSTARQITCLEASLIARLAASLGVAVWILTFRQIINTRICESDNSKD
ncbi:5487_t:CDS:1, partial [Acaulospora morrowiae]